MGMISAGTPSHQHPSPINYCGRSPCSTQAARLGGLHRSSGLGVPLNRLTPSVRPVRCRRRTADATRAGRISSTHGVVRHIDKPAGAGGDIVDVERVHVGEASSNPGRRSDPWSDPRRSSNSRRSSADGKRASPDLPPQCWPRIGPTARGLRGSPGELYDLRLGPPDDPLDFPAPGIERQPLLVAVAVPVVNRGDALR
jgi:hypothetical protein